MYLITHPGALNVVHIKAHMLDVSSRGKTSSLTCHVGVGAVKLPVSLLYQLFVSAASEETL